MAMAPFSQKAKEVRILGVIVSGWGKQEPVLKNGKMQRTWGVGMEEAAPRCLPVVKFFKI